MNDLLIALVFMVSLIFAMALIYLGYSVSVISGGYQSDASQLCSWKHAK